MRQEFVLKLLDQSIEFSVEGIVKQNGPSDCRIMDLKTYWVKSILSDKQPLAGWARAMLCATVKRYTPYSRSTLAMRTRKPAYPCRADSMPKKPGCCCANASMRAAMSA
ncbi:MAG: hypothetical protein RJB34_1504 [Pseudomonadota bacterium]